MLLYELLEHPADLGTVGDVGLVPGRLPALAAHRLHGPLGVIVTLDVVDADVRAVAGEKLGNATPDAASRAGDQHFLSFEKH